MAVSKMAFASASEDRASDSMARRRSAISSSVRGIPEMDERNSFLGNSEAVSGEVKFFSL